ncbi:PREDICTED: transcription cofactor HES-6 [Mandrillus leucophaeus]|uniref:transcription cofactor HES-6 n=1 Tax=Mandrillus leucophaeus TaxID=9568 RepID=UPI0005F47345|nr:PREDICTED: transcription cofactor HES-6 [Mandrillus leucophaeus]
MTHSLHFQLEGCSCLAQLQSTPSSASTHLSLPCIAALGYLAFPGWLPVFGSSRLEREQLQAEASERFAAGYIQCMHEVHTFVSTCQAIDATVAAELLNHLLESMPLREGSSFQDLLGDALAGPPGVPGRSGWPAGGAPGSPIPSLPGPGDDLCSDLEEAPEAELSRAPAEGSDLVPTALGSLTAAQIAQSVWRPW